MRLRWLLLATILLAGCHANDSPITRAAGSYPGAFAIESVGGSTDSRSIAAEVMKGNLELYVTGTKFTLDMTTAHQQFSIAGKWKAEKNRVTLVADKYTFNNPSEVDQKALNLKIIAPDEIRAVFGHPVILDSSDDRRRLTGLKISLGRLIGHFEFQRPIPH